MDINDAFVKAALYESCKNSEILKHINLSDLNVASLRALMNTENALHLKEFPIIIAKFMVKFGARFLTGKFPVLNNYITCENINVRVEADERSHLFLDNKIPTKSNIYLVVIKNIVTDMFGASLIKIKDDLLSNLTSEKPTKTKSNDADNKNEKSTKNSDEKININQINIDENLRAYVPKTFDFVETKSNAKPNDERKATTYKAAESNGKKRTYADSEENDENDNIKATNNTSLDEEENVQANKKQKINEDSNEYNESMLLQNNTSTSLSTPTPSNSDQLRPISNLSNISERNSLNLSSHSIENYKNIQPSSDDVMMDMSEKNDVKRNVDDNFIEKNSNKNIVILSDEKIQDANSSPNVYQKFSDYEESEDSRNNNNNNNTISINNNNNNNNKNNNMSANVSEIDYDDENINDYNNDFETISLISKMTEIEEELEDELEFINESQLKPISLKPDVVPFERYIKVFNNDNDDDEDENNDLEFDEKQSSFSEASQEQKNKNDHHHHHSEIDPEVFSNSEDECEEEYRFDDDED